MLGYGPNFLQGVWPKHVTGASAQMSLAVSYLFPFANICLIEYHFVVHLFSIIHIITHMMILIHI